MVNTDYQRGAYDSVTLQNIYFIIVFQKLVLAEFRHLRVTFSILRLCVGVFIDLDFYVLLKFSQKCGLSQR